MPEQLTVDIGGTTTRVAVARGSTLLTRCEQPTEAHAGPDHVIRRVLTLLADLPRPAAAVGVACTGRVHDDGHVTAVNTATMPGWTRVPLARRLREALGTPVHVLNDARAATLGEWHARNAPMDRNFMFVTVSTGIGSGLVLRGRLHAPAHGEDVGLGFTRGLSGPLEAGSSGTGLASLARSGGYASLKALFDAAEADDAAAQQVLAAPLTALAERLWDAHCLLGLHTICLGGSVGLRPYTRLFLKRQLAGPAAPDLHVARHGADAGLIGAALYARQQEHHA